MKGEGKEEYCIQVSMGHVRTKGQHKQRNIWNTDDTTISSHILQHQQMWATSSCTKNLSSPIKCQWTSKDKGSNIWFWTTAITAERSTWKENKEIRKKKRENRKEKRAKVSTEKM